MTKKTIANRLLKQIAEQRRVIVADWRLHIAYQRVAIQDGYKLPDLTRVRSLIRSLMRAEALQPLDDASGIYRVTVPYASVLPAPDEIILQECHPTAVFSFISAVAYHGWTNEIPAALYMTHYGGRHPHRLPLGTTPDDWVDVPKPRRRMPEHIQGRPVVWTTTKSPWDFGHQVGHVQGMPIYVTRPERTLVDALRFPDKSGGPLRVLEMWHRVIKEIDLDALIQCVEDFRIALLKQRVGFLIEGLGRSHAHLDQWAANSVRGSSAKLIAGLDFSSTYCDRWNLSLNLPESTLAGMFNGES